MAALFAVPGAASANSSQPTMLQDDAQIVHGSQAQRDRRLDELKSLGVEIVKVRLSWKLIAPDGNRKPAGFNGADPNAYPAGRWGPYDAVVSGAEARGLRVYFQLGGSAPEWATPGKKKSQVYRPSAAEFRAFVQAVGARYPSVSLFSVWNEPNLVNWLAPQKDAPEIYRKLVYAAADGLAASGEHSGDELLIGELLPYVGTGRRGRTRPIAFLREFACVDKRYRPYRGKAAKSRGCAKFKRIPGTGLAYHPYTLGGGPNVKVRNPDDAAIGQLSRVTKALDRIGSRGRVATRRMPLWITEFGFQSSPPDRFATPLRKIPGFMAQSEWIAFHNSRVRSYSQYPLVDDRALGGFQSGLRFARGSKKAKPKVYKAFQHTIYVRGSGSSRAVVFGCERVATSGTVTIEARRGSKGKWRRVGSASVNSLGYFKRTVKVKGAAKSQFRYRYGSSASRAAAPAGR
jgi:hypothetical protein